MLQKIIKSLLNKNNLLCTVNNFMFTSKINTRLTYCTNYITNNNYEYVANIITNNPISTLSDWIGVRNNLIENIRCINTKNVDSFILQHCTSTKNFSLAQSYLDYLKENNIKLNIGALGKFFRLYYFMKQANVVSNDEMIIKMYDDLRKTYKVLDSFSGENIISALSVTKNWKECLKLLEEIKITATPNSEAYSLTATAAFLNNEHDIAWNILQEMIAKSRTPQSVPYLTYLKICEGANVDKNDKIKMIEKLFYFFEYNDVKCNKEVSEKIVDVYQKLDFKPKITSVSTRGDCLNCRRRLQRLHLTNREFEDLKENFFKAAIIGKDVYSKTNPEEVERFKQFISNSAKYDVVVDGLNVAFSSGHKSKEFSSMLIKKVVNHFVMQNKRVLVIGRKHMSNWPAKNMNFIRSSATLFLTEDISYDDPFLLYCALNSGMNTIIVTRDLMRSHSCLLKDIRHKRLFIKWLTNSQYQLVKIDNKGKPIFKYPHPYLKSAQKEDKYWHLPCDMNSDEWSHLPEQWICLKP